MTKITVIIFFISFIFGLHNVQSQDNYSSEKINQTMFDTTIQEEVMIGKYNYKGMINSVIFHDYFDLASDEYTPYTDFLLDHKDSLRTVEITIVFGSWCSDSQREVPRLLILLKALDYPMDKVKIIAVNRQKEVPQMDIADLYVEYVPTIIFYKGKYEVGRIIEQPSESLEADIASFLFFEQ